MGHAYPNAHLQLICIINNVFPVRLVVQLVQVHQIVKVAKYLLQYYTIINVIKIVHLEHLLQEIFV